jgi:hypothetical protein
MAHPGFWDSMVRDVTGPGMFGGKFQFRLIVQPLVALILGLRYGIKDAKHGRLPIIERFRVGKGQRGQIFKQMLRDAIVPFVVALIIDSILQQMINHRIRPVAALVMGGLLVFVPFVLVRELTNRIWAHGHPGQRRQATQSR